MGSVMLFRRKLAFTNYIDEADLPPGLSVDMGVGWYGPGSMADADRS
jgi:hypothetical protein